MEAGRRCAIAFMAALAIHAAIAADNVPSSSEPLSLPLSTTQAATAPCSGCFCPGGCPAGASIPFKLVVPGGIGSDVDVVGRVLRFVAKENGGRQIELDNRAGVAGAAAGFVAKAAPDGNTALLVTAVMFAIYPQISASSSYDLLKE